jgi:hypothetical protein
MSYSSSGSEKGGFGERDSNGWGKLPKGTAELPYGNIVSDKERSQNLRDIPCHLCGEYYSDLPEYELKKKEMKYCQCRDHCGVCFRTSTENIFRLRSLKSYWKTSKKHYNDDKVKLDLYYEDVEPTCDCLNRYTEDEKYLAFQRTPTDKNYIEYRRLLAPTPTQLLHGITTASFEEIEVFLRVWGKYISYENIGDLYMAIAEKAWVGRLRGEYNPRRISRYDFRRNNTVFTTNNT